MNIPLKGDNVYVEYQKMLRILDSCETLSQLAMFRIIARRFRKKHGCSKKDFEDFPFYVRKKREELSLILENQQ